MSRRRTLALATAPALLVVLANSLITHFTDVRTSPMVNDPAATLEFPVYIGIFSYLSIALWIAAATIGLFAGWHPRGHRLARVPGRRAAGPLRSAGSSPLPPPTEAP